MTWDDVWELAGMVGMLPWDMTLRQLVCAARGRRRLEWSLTSSILAKVHNLMAKTPKSPSDFDPVVQEDLNNGS